MNEKIDPKEIERMRRYVIEKTGIDIVEDFGKDWLNEDGHCRYEFGCLGSNGTSCPHAYKGAPVCPIYLSNKGIDHKISKIKEELNKPIDHDNIVRF